MTSADKPVDIVASDSLLTNYLLLTIVTNSTQLNDDKPDVKLNNPLPPYDDTSTLIVTDSSFPLFLESTSTSTIRNTQVLDDEAPDLIKALLLSSFAKYPPFNPHDPFTLLLPVSALDIVLDPGSMELLIPDEILTLLLYLTNIYH